MNRLPETKQRAILSRLKGGTSIRSTAEFEGVAINTVKRLKRMPAMDRMRERYNIKLIMNSILPCGKYQTDCANCRDIFSENCGFSGSLYP